jgi:hypothetical protein
MTQDAENDIPAAGSAGESRQVPRAVRDEARQPLRDVLNLRLDSAMSQEIDRIAGRAGKSGSEVARQLLQYGIDVARKLEADDLLAPYWATHTSEDPLEYRAPLISAKWEWRREDPSGHDYED